MTKTNSSQATPRSLGYSMPAEWMPHRATWLAWPHNRATWPSQLENVREVWLQMIQALALNEQVVLLVNDEQTERDVVLRLKNVGAVMKNTSILKIPTVDVWMRDYGPTFLTRGGKSPLALNDWIFNGWGGKYQSYEDDDRVAKDIAALLQIPVFNHAVVLEGGSIEVNGAGTCLTTEQCLLNENRNPDMSRGEIERFLKDALGVSHIIWLAEGIVGDDTDGHIDDIARFIDPMTGDGLRFAIRGGELAASAALEAFAHGWSGVHARLAASRAREFAGKWRFNRALRALVASPSAVDAAALAARIAPGVLRATIAHAGDCRVAC